MKEEQDAGYQMALIEFDREGVEPVTVIMDRIHENGNRCIEIYYVDHSQRDGWAYHLTGGGGQTIDEPFTVTSPYWIRDDSIPIRHATSPTDGHWLIEGKPASFNPERLLELPELWNKTGRDKWGDWAIFSDMIDTHTEYCPTCGDCFHADQDVLCPHIRWCEECSMFDNPGEGGCGCTRSLAA